MTEALLKRFMPQLKYDSIEAFFADSAAQWTDNPGNELRRPGTAQGNAHVLAAATPKVGQEQLGLDFLGDTYPTGQAADPADEISNPTRNYRDQYVALRDRPGIANRIYGHAREDSDGRLWLQYWFWYFYNDYNLAGRIGLHEGDWEMVQFRMGNGEPDLAVYAQHRHAQRARWEDVEKVPGAPDTAVVYVARGSHASYFRKGYHETEAWYDIADGCRPAPPPPRMTLEIVGDADPSWVAWPGRWGDTRARNPKIESPSPDGPSRHDQWLDPKALLKDSMTFSVGRVVGSPNVKLAREHGLLRIDYDFTQDKVPPHVMVVTINSVDEKQVPPQAVNFSVANMRRGTIETTITVADDKEYDVSVATNDAQGRPSAAHHQTLKRAGRKGPRGVGVLRALARVVAAVRGVFGR